jgi:hypothetical protein
MKANHWMGVALTSVLLLGILAVWIPARPSQAQAPRQQEQTLTWEYKFVEEEFTLDQNEKNFSDVGKLGWEYCGTRSMVTRGDGNRPIINFNIFKRPIKLALPDHK